MKSADGGINADERRQYRNDQVFVIPLPASFAPVVDSVGVGGADKEIVRSVNINVPKSKSSSIPTTDHPHRPSPPSSAPVFDVISNKTFTGGTGARRKNLLQEKGSTSHPNHPHASTKGSVFDVVDHTKRRTPKDYPSLASQSWTPRSTGSLFYPVPGDSSSDSRRTVASASSSSQLRNGPIYQQLHHHQPQQQRPTTKSEQHIPQDRQKTPRSNIPAATKTTVSDSRRPIAHQMSEDRLISSKTSAHVSSDDKVNSSENIINWYHI